MKAAVPSEHNSRQFHTTRIIHCVTQINSKQLNVASQPRGVHFIGSINLPTTSDPLKKLECEAPEPYLGLVHPDDEQGTREMIKKAKEVVGVFGDATECGLGRMPREELGSIVEIVGRVIATVEDDIGANI